MVTPQTIMLFHHPPSGLVDWQSAQLALTIARHRIGELRFHARAHSFHIHGNDPAAVDGAAVFERATISTIAVLNVNHSHVFVLGCVVFVPAKPDGLSDNWHSAKGGIADDVTPGNDDYYLFAHARVMPHTANRFAVYRALSLTRPCVVDYAETERARRLSFWRF